LGHDRRFSRPERAKCAAARHPPPVSGIKEGFHTVWLKRIAEAIAIEMNERPARFPIGDLVGEDHLVDAVIVPLVMRGHLIDPFGHAAIKIAGPDRH
jgi:hypothetical protein